MVPARVRLTISQKFFAVLAVLAPLVVAVALAGMAGLGTMKAEFDRVFADNIHTSQGSTRLGADFARADEIALRLAAATDPGERRQLFANLDHRLVPAIDTGLSELHAFTPGIRAPRAPERSGCRGGGLSSSRFGTPAP